MSSDGEEDQEEQWGELAAELDLGGDSSTDEDADDHAPAAPAPPPAPPPPLGVARRARLSASEFQSEFRHREPVLLAGLASGWPALARWASAEHLASLLDEDVLVLRSPDGRRFLKRDCEQQRRPFGDVVRELFGDREAASEPSGRMYARSPLAAGLRAEVELGDLEEMVGGAVFKDENSGVWLGTAGNVTPLHYDLCHGFLVQVIGVKVVTYFEPDDYRCLYQRAQHPELSQVDLDAWRREEAEAEAEAADSKREEGTGREEERRGGGDASAAAASATATVISIAGSLQHDKWPRFADAMGRCRRVVLRPGDILYTPPFWWHHVATVEEQQEEQQEEGEGEGDAEETIGGAGPSERAAAAGAAGGGGGGGRVGAAALSVLVPFDMSPEEPVHPAHFM